MSKLAQLVSVELKITFFPRFEHILKISKGVWSSKCPNFMKMQLEQLLC